MKIKHKTLITALVSTLLVILMTYIVFHIAFFGYINTAQEDQTAKSFDVINYMLLNEKHSLETTIVDWAHWDDTYAFINHPNTDYINSNLKYNILADLKLKMLVFLDSEGDIVYSKDENLSKNTISVINSRLIFNKRNLYALTSLENKNYIRSGILIVEKVPYLVAISPITNSMKSSSCNGSLIMIREIDRAMLGYIQNVTEVQLSFSELSVEHFRLHDKESLLSPYIKGNHFRSPSSFQATRTIKDITGADSIELTIIKEYANYNEIFHYFRVFIVSFLIIILLINLTDYLMIGKYILTRLLKLNTFMNTVAATKDTSLTITMSGNDELYELSQSTNKMLNQLDVAYKDIKKMGKRFRLLMESTNDGYLEYNLKTKELYISTEWRTMMGYKGHNGHELYEDYISKIHPDNYEQLKHIISLMIDGHTDYFHAEYQVIQSSGEIIWVLHRGKMIEEDASGEQVTLISTLTNITEHKLYEKEILFLSYSDKLTGLRNRAYMEEQFELLNSKSDSHYFIIMGDLNGLKLINDALGHKEGDKMLQIAGDILRKACNEDDIISRWGGDEFIILVNNKSRNYVLDIIDSIKIACENALDFHINISIALGYAEKDEESLDTNAIMSLAENRMYRNKLIESQSARSATISSLSRTLHEKHSETEEHTARIRDLSLQLGARLNLSQDKLDELELLALLHDIGKIGIPDHILLKPGKLTNEEWQTMKTHTEIGYRIAKSTPDLSHIAYEILAHHERYDGNGYPSGLKGKEIPLLSRIINIADSFDVMTHKRTYKDAMSIDFAIEEIKRCSGTQFDPVIADEFLSLLKETDSFSIS